jgi:hypothetical protein
MSNPIVTLQQLAQLITDRGLTAPAIFTLELLKPLTGCARELYGIGEGLLMALFGGSGSLAVRELLSSSDRVEELITILERRER